MLLLVLVAITTPSMPHTSLPAIRARDMSLTIQPLPIIRNRSHPRNHSSVDALNLKIRALLLQLLCNCIDIDTEIVAQEIADFSVLMVSDKCRCDLRVGTVDVDVGRAMAVGGPPGLAATRDSVRETVLGCVWVVDDLLNLVIFIFLDTQAFGEGILHVGFDSIV